LWMPHVVVELNINNCRFVEKLTNIKLTENISDRIWIHETLQVINRYFKI